MSIEIRVPQLPESIADATLVAWHKKPGDAVSRDENLADLETDKVVLEVPAPANGVMRELKVESGATVTPGQLLAVLEEGAATAAATSTSANKPAAPAPSPEGAKESGKLSPSVRRLIEENGLDPATIPASGRDGRLTKSDVVGYLARARAPAAAPSAAPAAAPVDRAPPPPAARSTKPAAPAGGRAELR